VFLSEGAVFIRSAGRKFVPNLCDRNKPAYRTDRLRTGIYFCEEDDTFEVVFSY
jgi:hypothetical protein